MTSEILQIHRMLKSQKKVIKYLRSLSPEELKAALRAEIEPEKWSEFAEQARVVSLRLEELASAVELAAKR